MKILNPNPTVVAFHERKIVPEQPKPIRPPALNGQPPTREQIQETLRCAERFLKSDDMSEAMLMYRAIEGVAMVTRVSLSLNQMAKLDLVWLRRWLNRILNDIKTVSG